jgi:hypothetical protein
MRANPTSAETRDSAPEPFVVPAASSLTPVANALGTHTLPDYLNESRMSADDVSAHHAGQPGLPHPRRRVREWVRRYLPYEIISAIAELGGAGFAYLITDSLAAAALAGTVGAAVGYYATAFIAAVRLAFRHQEKHAGPMRAIVATALALRSVAVEFGPAELIDSVTVRPAAYYFMPTLLGNVVGGWLAAKLISDAAFYLLAIFSYEKLGRMLVRPVDEFRHPTN